MQPPSLSHRTIDLTELIDLEKATRSGPPSARLAWARQLVRHVRRTLPPPAPTPAPSKKPTSEPSKALPTNLPTDPVLAGLLDQALTFILSLAHPAQGASAGAKDLVYAEALFVSADLSATGEFPTFKVKDLRTSFRSFESSARAGWQASWYRLGRDYEGVGDPTRAVECFERGVKGMDKSSLYVSVSFCVSRRVSRWGGWTPSELGADRSMSLVCLAHPPETRNGSPSWPARLGKGSSSVYRPSSTSCRRGGRGQCPFGPIHFGHARFALTPHLASPLPPSQDLPIPAYLFAMLLAGEVDLPVSPASLLLPHQLPSTPTPESTLDTLLSLSRHYLLLSATLSYPPAQLRIGQAFEHATLGCPFDPLLSVQWYLVASQNGEEEADMGLAKWFLVGAEGYLEKNEGLAFSFAEKAARRGLGAGLFAVGYFYELGIGRERDLGKARKYYKRVSGLSRFLHALEFLMLTSRSVHSPGRPPSQPRRHHPSRSSQPAHTVPSLARGTPFTRRDQARSQANRRQSPLGAKPLYPRRRRRRSPTSYCPVGLRPCPAAANASDDGPAAYTCPRRRNQRGHGETEARERISARGTISSASPAVSATSALSPASAT